MRRRENLASALGIQNENGRGGGGVNTHFSEIIRLQFGKERQNINVSNRLDIQATHSLHYWIRLWEHDLNSVSSVLSKLNPKNRSRNHSYPG